MSESIHIINGIQKKQYISQYGAMIGYAGAAYGIQKYACSKFVTWFKAI
jgi:hypothetical protein